MKLCIIIPAYNEEKRIDHAIDAYHLFFNSRSRVGDLSAMLLVVMNGCTDNTQQVVASMMNEDRPNVRAISIPQAGKGLAIKAGFEWALAHDYDLIGFVDADLSTSPQYFYDLVQTIELAEATEVIDGAIASRYMPDSIVVPERPWIKRLGSLLIYEPLVFLLFGMSYYDLQCGAKLFTRAVIKKVCPELTVAQWAFDVELLYLCKLHQFTVVEIPTIWRDKAGSKLSIMNGGLRMLSTLIKLRIAYSRFAWLLNK